MKKIQIDLDLLEVIVIKKKKKKNPIGFRTTILNILILESHVCHFIRVLIGLKS